MANINNRVKLWRGTRAKYNALGTWDYWTEYNVKETNGTWTKYYGTKEVTGDYGELAPVEGIITTTELGQLDASSKTQGSRWLVGSGSNYFIVEFGPTASIEATRIDPLGSYSVRVKNRGLKAYEIVGGELYTYDHDALEFASGDTPTTAQTTAEVGFEVSSGLVTGHIILDTELDEESDNPVTNSAVATAIFDNEIVVSAALNDLNNRIIALSGATPSVESGDGYVVVDDSTPGEVEISLNAATALTDASAAGDVADAKAVVDYVKSKIGALKNVTSIGGVNVPTSASTYNVAGSSYISASTVASGASGIVTNLSVIMAGMNDTSATGITTNADIREYINGLLTAVMQFQGSTATVPQSPSNGDVYIASAPFDISGVGHVETGDYIVYYQPSGQQGSWSIIEKNDTGVVTSTGLTTNALVVANGSNTVISAGNVGSVTLPIYLNNGVPTAITAPASGTTELAYGSAVTLATVEGLDIVAELPALDDTLDSASTNAVENRAIYNVIVENELVTAAALNDLSGRISDVESEIENLDVEVLDCAATLSVNGNAETLATVGGTDITADVYMSSLTIAGANSLTDGVTFDGTTNIEILVLDCGEY